MKQAIFGVMMIVVGLAGFMALPPENGVRYLSLGMAITGVLVLLTAYMQSGGSE